MTPKELNALLLREIRACAGVERLSGGWLRRRTGLATRIKKDGAVRLRADLVLSHGFGAIVVARRVEDAIRNALESHPDYLLLHADLRFIQLGRPTGG